MRRDTRDRVTVDFRGAGALVQERAAARGVTVAAFVRQAVLTVTGQPPGPGGSPECIKGGELVKVTLRLPAAHAFLLATRSRRAEVSQGAYVAGLIDGTPVPVVVDRREAVAALLRSTDQLAVISTDLNTFLRLLKQGASAKTEAYRERVMTLPDDVRNHLIIAGGFLSDLSGATSRSSAARSAVRRT